MGGVLGRVDGALSSLLVDSRGRAHGHVFTDARPRIHRCAATRSQMHGHRSRERTRHGQAGSNDASHIISKSCANNVWPTSGDPGSSFEGDESRERRARRRVARVRVLGMVLGGRRGTSVHIRSRATSVSAGSSSRLFYSRHRISDHMLRPRSGPIQSDRCTHLTVTRWYFCKNPTIHDCVPTSHLGTPVVSVFVTCLLCFVLGVGDLLRLIERRGRNHALQCLHRRQSTPKNIVSNRNCPSRCKQAGLGLVKQARPRRLLGLAA